MNRHQPLPLCRNRLQSAIIVSWSSLLLMAILCLGGCDSSSGTQTVYSPAGSWKGTLNGIAVEAMIAPDGFYQIAYADDSGVIGGTISSVTENVASGTATARGAVNQQGGKLKAAVTASSISGRITFDADWPLYLTRTADAETTVVQGTLVGFWGFNPNSSISNLSIDAAGGISGSSQDGRCLWNGKIIRFSGWNLWDILLTVTSASTSSPCLSNDLGSWRGLGLYIDSEKLLRTALSDTNIYGAKFKSADWYIVDPERPIANAGPDRSYFIAAGSETSIQLDGSGSSDPNLDLLNYTWTVVSRPTDSFVGDPPAVEKPLFTPDKSGDYIFRLIVDDGVLTANVADEVKISVVIAPNRFTDQCNGTVYDYLTDRVWLKDVKNFPYDPLANWGAAQLIVSNLAADGASLSDGSVAGNWRLPSRAEFTNLFDLRYSDPALADTTGNFPWTTDGAPFIITAPPAGLTWSNWYFWTSDTPGPYIDTSTGEEIEYYNALETNLNGNFVELSKGTIGNYIWPVRNLRVDEVVGSGSCP